MKRPKRDPVREEAKCITTKIFSPLKKGETVEALRDDNRWQSV
jgi:hypothetical protein